MMLIFVEYQTIYAFKLDLIDLVTADSNHRHIITYVNLTP